MAVTSQSRVRSILHTLALVACSAVSVCLLMLGLLLAWVSISRITGLTPTPPGTEFRWQTPALGILWAAGCFASSAAFAYIGVSTWWPDLTPRGRA